MITYILDATEGLFDRRVVVTRHEDAARLCRERNVDVVMHNLPHRSDTIRLGLEAIGDVDRCMFCAADQPLLSRETIGKMLRCATEQKELILRASGNGQPGSPVIFPRWTFDKLKNLPDEEGGSRIIREYPDHVACIEVNDCFELADADTRENLQKLERLVKPCANNLVIVRGGGDLATGTIYKLKKCGFDVLILETERPSAIRRSVSFCEAVYRGEHTVEDMTCVLAGSVAAAKALLDAGRLAILVDTEGSAVDALKPLAVVDGIMAKKNLGTHKDMAPVTVALGPGFEAGKDVTAVIETNRGHNLGKIIWSGSAEPDTGVPGTICGYSRERVIHSPASGTLRSINKIADIVSEGDVIAVVETAGGDVPVRATLNGLLRGMICDGYPVSQGLKIADIDPRIHEYKNCFTISDKARCIAGGVVEVILQEKGRLGL